MARGTTAKTLIGNAILQVFPGSFIDTDRKTIRIPTTCENELIEIKVTLTAAKDVINENGVSSSVVASSTPTAEPQNRAMTDEEIAEVRDLIARMGL